MASPEEIYAAEKFFLGNQDYKGYQEYIKSVSKADYQRYVSKRAVLIESDRSGGQKVSDAVGTLLLGAPGAGGGRLAAQSGARAIGRNAPKEVLEYVAARKAGQTIKASPAVTSWLTKNYGGVLSGMGGINAALAKTTTEKVGEQAGRLIGRAIPKSKVGKLAAGAAAGGGAYALLQKLRGGSDSQIGGGTETVNPEDAMRLAQDEFTGTGAGGPGAGTLLGQLVKKYTDLGFDPDTALEAAQEELLRQLSGEGGGGSGVGSAQIAEQRRQYDLSKEFDERKYAQDYARGVVEFDKNYALDLEKVGLTREQIAAQKSQFAQNFAEDQRQFGIQEGRLNRSLDLETELGRGTLAETTRSNKEREAAMRRERELAEQQYIGQILSRPSDFLARAFSSRGGTSPFATVSQADLINNLQAGVKNATQGFAKGGTTQEGKFVTGEQGAEVIINPTNAPIMVLNHQQSKGAMGKLPGYAGGTQDPNDPNFDWGDYMRQSDINPVAASGGGSYGSFIPDPFDNESPYKGWNQGGQYSPYGAGRIARRPKPQGTPTATTYDFTPEEYGIWQRRVDELVSGGVMDRIGAGDSAFYELLSSGAIGDPSWGMMGPFNRSSTMTAPPPKQLTQAELIALAKSSAPPAVLSAAEGGRIPAARPYGQLTPGKLQRLTGPELEAMNTYLAAVGNTDLATESGLLQQRFGPVVSRSRGRLQV